MVETFIERARVCIYLAKTRFGESIDADIGSIGRERTFEVRRTCGSLPLVVPSRVVAKILESRDLDDASAPGYMAPTSNWP